MANTEEDMMRAAASSVNEMVGIKELVEGGLREVPPIYVRPPEERPHIWPGHPDHSDATDIIDAQFPVIDLSHLAQSQSQYECEEMHKLTVQQIGQACRDWGFFQIVNHGVGDESIENLHLAARQFFDLPTSERLEYSRTFPKWLAYSTAFNPSFERTRNWKETLIFNPLPGQETNAFQDAPSMFKEPVLEYIAKVEVLARILYKAILQSLGLDDEDIENVVPKIPRLLMGINYYPPCLDPSVTLGLSGHCDINCVTILHMDDTPGLQVKYKGNWIPLKPTERNAFIVNLGDIMEILSNGKYKSVEHRVVTNQEKQRISMACFFAPNEDTLLTPIPCTINEKCPPLYKSIKHGDYVKLFFSNKLSYGQSTLDHVKIKYESI